MSNRKATLIISVLLNFKNTIFLFLLFILSDCCTHETYVILYTVNYLIYLNNDH